MTNQGNFIHLNEKIASLSQEMADKNNAKEDLEHAFLDKHRISREEFDREWDTLHARSLEIQREYEDECARQVGPGHNLPLLPTIRQKSDK